MKRLETDGFRFRWTGGQPSRGERAGGFVDWLHCGRMKQRGATTIHRRCCKPASYLSSLPPLGPPTLRCLCFLPTAIYYVPFVHRLQTLTSRRVRSALCTLRAVRLASQIRHVQDAPISVDTCVSRRILAQHRTPSTFPNTLPSLFLSLSLCHEDRPCRSEEIKIKREVE